MEGAEAPVVGIMVGSYWEFGVVALWDRVSPECSAGLWLGLRWGGRKWLLFPGGDIMVPWTSPWSWPFAKMGGDGSMSVRETCNKLIPILFMGCFFNQALERSECINCDFRDVHKQELEVLHNKIFVVEKGSSDLTSLVTACHQHLLGWVIVRSSH
jgi:hypothetical protein